MKIIKNTYDYLTLSGKQKELLLSGALFYDIETTGFSAASSQLYLIGCLMLENEKVTLLQYFAESKEDEPLLLSSFQKLAQKATCLVSFNGIQFDNRYLAEKYKKHVMNATFLTIPQCDYFVKYSHFKNFLGLNNFRQKSVEDFLSTNRKDEFNGEQLIQVYRNYQKKHLEEDLELLLLHNAEDVLGLLSLENLGYYKDFICGDFTINCFERKHRKDFENRMLDQLEITIQPNHPLPRELQYFSIDLQLLLKPEKCLLQINLTNEKTRYYYSDYKNYYYLPTEDLAIHKDLAQYTSSALKTKATRKTAYQWISVDTLLNSEDTMKKNFVINQLQFLAEYKV